MSEISIKIGKFNAETKDVPVTFTRGEFTHRRSVNACLTSAGKYDAAATAARVDEVGLGVVAKIDAGVITPDA